MKQLLLLGLTALVSLPCWGQITIMSEPTKKEPVVAPYDSLQNMKKQKNGEDYNFEHLIGQTIMFCGDPYITAKKRPYSPGDYFTIERTLENDPPRGFYDGLLIKSQKDGEEYKIGGIGDGEKYNWQWVVLGHYEKMKEEFIGRAFIYNGPVDTYSYFEKQDYPTNVETGETKKDIKKGSIWKCTDVQVKPRQADDHMVIDKRSPIVLVFENDTYGKYYAYYEGREGYVIASSSNMICGLFKDKAKTDQARQANAKKAAERKAALIKKYGQEKGTLIAEGKIRVGMTKDMCIDAWGKPSEINKTTNAYGTHEQWVYGSGNYVYFDNGVITTIQN